MEDLIKRQNKFQKDIFSRNLESLNKEDRIKYSNIMLLALIEEIGEIMSCYKAFEWKKEREEVDNLKEEIIDAFHFLFNLCLIWGIPDIETLSKLYMQKLDKNYKRGILHDSDSHNHGK